MTQPESRFDRSLVEPRLCHGVDTASKGYGPAGVNGRRDAVRLCQQSARHQKKEMDDTGSAYHACIITRFRGGAGGLAAGVENRHFYRMAYEFSTFM
jgi:hypothetical protein